MCGHKQIGIWEVSKITVVDSNVVNHLSGHQVSPLGGVTSQCDVTAHDLPFVPIYK